MNDGLVYVVGSSSADAPVKIGYTRKGIDKRLIALRTSSPVDLGVIATIPAPYFVEKALHAVCGDYRLRGEWFERKGPVREVIRMMRTSPSFLDGVGDPAKRLIWLPDAVAACPGAESIWNLLRESSAPLRGWADKEVDGVDDCDVVAPINGRSVRPNRRAKGGGRKATIDFIGPRRWRGRPPILEPRPWQQLGISRMTWWRRMEREKVK